MTVLAEPIEMLKKPKTVQLYCVKLAPCHKASECYLANSFTIDSPLNFPCHIHLSNLQGRLHLTEPLINRLYINSYNGIMGRTFTHKAT
jgi:hypothetical protein